MALNKVFFAKNGSCSWAITRMGTTRHHIWERLGHLWTILVDTQRWALCTVHMGSVTCMTGQCADGQPNITKASAANLVEDAAVVLTHHKEWWTNFNHVQEALMMLMEESRKQFGDLPGN